MTVSDKREMLIFAEQRRGRVHPVAFELLGKAIELSGNRDLTVSAVLLGSNVRGEAQELIYYGAKRVYLFDDPSFYNYDPFLYKANLVALARKINPYAILFGSTHIGRSLAPRVAADLQTGLTADCTDLSIDEDGTFIQTRPAFTGNILAHIKTKTTPSMSTVRYKVMQRASRDENREGVVVNMTPLSSVPSWRVICEHIIEGIGLADAEVIVSGGRGLKRPEDFKMLEELAKLLGGVVGSSRPLVDEGWIGKEHQVGFSGNTVKPKLYIACGISGSPQHLAGMRDSEVIIAINLDPSAPIFRYADIGIIGDIYEVVPRFIEILRSVLGSSVLGSDL